MLNKTFDIELNTKFQGGHSTDIFVSQGDISSVIFNFRIKDGLSEINYSDVASAFLIIAKPDNSVVQLTANPRGGGGYTVMLSRQALASVGKVLGGLALNGHNGERIVTLLFTFVVGRDLLSQDDIESSSEFDALQRAVALLEWLLRKVHEFPQLKSLGRFNTRAELLEVFPDGSALDGGFWVGNNTEELFYFWDIVTNQWVGIDPLRGRTGRHMIAINTPHTAQYLHYLGVRVGDSVVVSTNLEPGILVAGAIRESGAILERISDDVSNAAFVERGTIRGARGEPGTVNARGSWNILVHDYQRYDTVTYPLEGGNTYIYTSRTPGIQLSPRSDSLDNPWQMWVYRGLQGEAATIQIGSVSTGAAGSNASIINVGTENDAILDIVIPRGDQGASGINIPLANGFFRFEIEDGYLYIVSHSGGAHGFSIDEEGYLVLDM